MLGLLERGEGATCGCGEATPSPSSVGEWNVSPGPNSPEAMEHTHMARSLNPSPNRHQLIPARQPRCNTPAGVAESMALPPSSTSVGADTSRLTPTELKPPA
eukprot:CAMPEP_0175880154 /NCGR_PEP_ID=MMETSP0107_2-20121207/42161_1 /TAXON_ID=195067 ORGANISM="Goniomonas pacifica, Strain CCMP1869" /NCGR_SAMPLE_ID=MMETSP0107_2 /ASSEMBLY_ACC=CAM_ASM_000203 /LENGTH=101 /DNA_ID=CAMNT_0017199869 /DNA_START=133 /DNA_END=434 /DNA_ORIENTATION=+